MSNLKFKVGKYEKSEDAKQVFYGEFLIISHQNSSIVPLDSWMVSLLENKRLVYWEVLTGAFLRDF